MPMPQSRIGTKGKRRIYHVPRRAYRRPMAALLALSLLAAPLGNSAAVPGDGAPRIAVTASAQAFVRILPGARIVMDELATSAEHKFIDASITVEDGSQRDAKLVEFQ
jgi:hypothetical protein